ncbi:MAG TPA: murein L,D-transpeptidase catalytic domain family protein [Sphingobium sp.]
MVMGTHIPRRGLLQMGGVAIASALVAPRAAAAAVQGPPAQWVPLVERAMGAFERHSERITQRDRFAVVDFSLPSSTPRMLLIDRTRGLHQLMRVAHGRGSDPAHSGWLKAFSNAPGSYASSRGVYVTGPTYVGKHGHSRRLIGLDDSNNNAEARAIVIHGAWYCNDDILRSNGKLGRSEGCFAVSEGEIEPLLDWLGPDRLLYADKL